MSQVIPAPYPKPFFGAIAHPDLYLWDCWSYREKTTLHLYCLAVSRYTVDKQILQPADRNHHPFHVRHFVSDDNGASWLDAGCFQQPRTSSEHFDSRTIWSGSITPLDDGRKLVAYTGIKELGETLMFQQSMGVALSLDGAKLESGSEQLISSSYDDWQDITNHGYYLGDRDSLGHKDGENGGPISAWRDPFILTKEAEIYMFWCAKVDSQTPALGRAKLGETADGFVIKELFPPAVMPDAESYTQLELPKIIHDDVTDKWYLIISTCNRLYEGQSDADVDKQIRLYKSDSIEGPWKPFNEEHSALVFEESNMFGLTVIDADFDRGELRCIAPFTDAASSEKSMTLSSVFSIHLNTAAHLAAENSHLSR